MTAEPNNQELHRVLLAFRDRMCDGLTYQKCAERYNSDDWVLTESLPGPDGEDKYFLKQQILYLDTDSSGDFATLHHYAWDLSDDSAPGLETESYVCDSGVFEHGKVTTSK